jgi:CelD/BcsL family acetyltransferase involved in cellulose biosynthesis
MKIEIIREEDGWAEIATQWNDLLDISVSKVPFLRYEFQRAWWQHRGGGEWPESELFIFVGRGDAGEINGIAPLFRAKDENGKQVLMLIGSHEIADFLDVLVSEKELEAFLAEIFAWLKNNESEWDVLDLWNILDSSPTLDAVQKAAEAASMRADTSQIQASPIITLPTSVDEYFESLDSKYRRELRRKIRNAASFFLPVDWCFCDCDVLPSEVECLAGLMRNEAAKAEFLTPKMEEQMLAIAEAFKEAGMLQLAFLQAGKDKAAAYFNIDFDNRIWVYNSGLNNKFQMISPGMVLLSYLIMDAIENGRSHFDMMRGDEEYKYHLNGKNRFVMRVQITR